MVNKVAKSRSDARMWVARPVAIESTTNRQYDGVAVALRRRS